MTGCLYSDLTIYSVLSSVNPVICYLSPVIRKKTLREPVHHEVMKQPAWVISVYEKGKMPPNDGIKDRARRLVRGRKTAGSEIPGVEYVQ